MTDFVDPYLDPTTGILRNFAGATMQEELRKAETDVASVAEIALENVPRTNDLAELQAIHKTLFGKIYGWAEEAGYTLDNPDFAALYLTEASAEIKDCEGETKWKGSF